MDLLPNTGYDCKKIKALLVPVEFLDTDIKKKKRDCKKPNTFLVPLRIISYSEYFYCGVFVLAKKKKKNFFSHNL